MEESSAIASSRVPLRPGPACPPGKHFPAQAVSVWGWGCLSRVGWWSRVWCPCWAPRAWGWENCQSNPETKLRTWNICSVGCGRGSLGHRGFLTCCFPYYLSIPFKKSQTEPVVQFSIIWACKTVQQTELNQSHCPSPAQKGQWVFGKPRWAPPPPYGGCHEHRPLYRKQLGKSSGKAIEKAEGNYF